MSWSVRFLAICFSLLIAVPAYADCDIANFFDRSSGTSDSAQYLSAMSMFSESDWNSSGQSFSGGGSYGVISGHASYAEMRQNLKSVLSQNSLSSGSKSIQAYATSSLSDKDLAAYMNCVGGFQVSVAELDANNPALAKLKISWKPTENQSLDSLTTILDQQNVGNTNEITKLLGSKPWGANSKSFDIMLKKTDPQKFAYITIAAGGNARTVYVPAPAPRIVMSDIEVPDDFTCVSGPPKDVMTCPIGSTDYTVQNGKISVIADLRSIEITKRPTGDSDPHREGYINIHCGGKPKNSRYLGATNTDRAFDKYFGVAYCHARPGETIQILADAQPRDGSVMIINGGIHIIDAP